MRLSTNNQLHQGIGVSWDMNIGCENSPGFLKRYGRYILYAIVLFATITFCSFYGFTMGFGIQSWYTNWIWIWVIGALLLIWGGMRLFRHFKI